MTFTAELWNTIDHIYASILAHPFNRELASGTLPEEKFQFYIKQDALYLMDFAKALALLAAKSSTAEDIVQFIKFSESAIVAERSLHEFYFSLYKTTLDVNYAPACFAYTNYMLASAALRNYEEGIAALLPCFWIYREVGQHIYSHVSGQPSYAHHPYKNWIDMYASEEYGELVSQMLRITDRVAAATTVHTRELMKSAFVYSSRLEWLFWDSAYQLEAWQP
ncbi:MAG: thiaminase II [Chloroherpetonaceae bacterium]|nr:thiaminase II [Chloroherpetonaceae bacterium]